MNQKKNGYTGKIHFTGMILILSLLFMLSFTNVNVAASSPLSVIPGAHGYGMETPAGRGGTVYKVVSLSDANKPGTLRYAINQKGPRVIVFEVSGTIQVDGYLEIRNPYITIAGQTAPSPGIFLRGAVISVMTHDVLIQHLRVAPGDDPKGIEGANRDCLGINNYNEPPTNVVIDHCTFTWSVDELFQIWYDAGDVTFRNILASEPLHDSIHVENGVREVHGFGPMFGNYANTRVTLEGNLISHCAARMPNSGSGSLVMVNNFIYDQAGQMTLLNNQSGVSTKNSIVGNVFVNGPSCPDWSRFNKPIVLPSETGPKTRLYVSDNLFSNLEQINDPWELVSNQSKRTNEILRATAPPVWNEGLVAKPASEVKASVLKNTGARPADRLPYETKIINNAENGTGKMVNSVTEAGGWPEVAENYRKLDLPENPNEDKDGDGYTNLEEWLHTYAAAVEGTGQPITDPVTKGIPDIALPTPAIKPLTDFPAILEAETDTTFDRAGISTDTTGYSGDGFIDYMNEPGGYIEWTAYLPKAGQYSLKFIYGNGKEDRPAELRVNGDVIQSSMSFPSTGSFSTWMESSSVVCSLKQGNNVIRLTAVGPEGGANIDSMLVSVQEGDSSPEATETPTTAAVPATGGTVKSKSLVYGLILFVIAAGAVLTFTFITRRKKRK